MLSSTSSKWRDVKVPRSKRTLRLIYRYGWVSSWRKEILSSLKIHNTSAKNTWTTWKQELKWSIFDYKVHTFTKTFWNFAQILPKSMFSSTLLRTEMLSYKDTLEWFLKWQIQQKFLKTINSLQILRDSPISKEKYLINISDKGYNSRLTRIRYSIDKSTIIMTWWTRTWRLQTRGCVCDYVT